MTDLENREAFEKEIIALCGFNPNTALERSEATGDYKSDVIYFAWLMWNASAQREGFKLVPLEPTKEMIDCVYNEDGNYIDSIDGSPESFYKAMINAV